MAITIKNIPVLEGATAEDFVRSADKNAAKVTPRLSVEAKKRLRKVLEKSRSFRFNQQQWTVFLYMMIVSCLPITRKYGGIAFLSLVARMTLMIFFSMMPICMRMNSLGKHIVG